MSEKGLKALVMALGGLALLWVGLSLFSGLGGGPQGASEELSGFFAGLTPETVTAVRMAGPGGATPVELRGGGGGWTVNGFRADSGGVARFWEDLAEARVGDLVASNPANHARMGLAEDSTWSFGVEQLSGESRTLLVGNPGSGYGTAYVRLPGEDQVHLLRGNLRSHLTRSLDNWRDKAVARVDTAAVWRVVVVREGEGFTLERSDSLWVLEGGGEADANTARNILGELGRLDATGFFAPGDSLSEVGGSIAAMGPTGDTLFSMELGSGDGDRWARIPGDSITYRLPSWRVNRLLPERDAVERGG